MFHQAETCVEATRRDDRRVPYVGTGGGGPLLSLGRWPWVEAWNKTRQSCNDPLAGGPCHFPSLRSSFAYICSEEEEGEEEAEEEAAEEEEEAR